MQPCLAFMHRELLVYGTVLWYWWDGLMSKAGAVQCCRGLFPLGRVTPISGSCGQLLCPLSLNNHNAAKRDLGKGCRAGCVCHCWPIIALLVVCLLEDVLLRSCFLARAYMTYMMLSLFITACRCAVCLDTHVTLPARCSLFRNEQRSAGAVLPAP